MRNYPGRTVEEIVNLAADITANMGGGATHSEYVEFCMVPAAEQQLEDYGDDYLETVGYSVSTAAKCARRVAHELDTLGYVDIS